MKIETNKTDEAAASTLIPLPKSRQKELEVDVFQEQQESDQQHATCQKDERTREVEDAQRQTRFTFCVVLLAFAGQPKLLQSLHLTCNKLPCFYKLNINFWLIKAWLSTAWIMTSFEINSFGFSVASLRRIRSYQVGSWIFWTNDYDNFMLFSVLQGSVPGSLFYKLPSTTSLKRYFFYPLVSVVCECDLQISWQWFHDW